MQTVTFQCGHCGNLMAVSTEFLGQQVRCPHCQQVVIAPASNAPAPPRPPADDPFRTITVDQHEAEDIFGSNEEGSDALFGGNQKLEIPREPAPAPPPPDPAPFPPSAPFPALGFDSPPGNHTLPEPAQAPPPSFANNTAAEHSPTWQDSEPPPVATESENVRKVREQAGGNWWFIPLVFIPLILYAVLATAAAGFLYLKIKTAPPNRFEMMPDTEGDSPGVIRFRKTTMRWTKTQATAALPDNLIIPLGKTLALGDIEVTPVKVERKKLNIFVETFEKSEKAEHESLVLHLKLHNLSDEWAFAPLDCYFDRVYDGKTVPVPLTYLQAGNKQFFGGANLWYSLDIPADKRKARRQYTEGRRDVDREGLAPGATRTEIVATNPYDPKIPAFLFGEGRSKGFRGKFLWRVQLRRGLVTVNGKQVPACAVIGVSFTDRDIRRGEG